MVPFVEREIEVFADEYVDPSFGTGVLKVTPAHDPNDFEIAGRLGLDPVNVLNPDGTINEVGRPLRGDEPAGCPRRRRGAVGRARSARGGPRLPLQSRALRPVRDGPSKPWLTEQWWVSMRELAEPAIEVLRKREIVVYPDSWCRETSTLAREHPRLERLQAALVGPPNPRLVRAERRGRRLQGIARRGLQAGP